MHESEMEKEEQRRRTKQGTLNHLSSDQWTIQRFTQVTPDLALNPASVTCVALGLSFFIFKMGRLTLPISQSYENYKELKVCPGPSKCSVSAVSKYKALSYPYLSLNLKMCT